METSAAINPTLDKNPQSFSRLEVGPQQTHRRRTSSLQNRIQPHQLPPNISTASSEHEKLQKEDIFETPDTALGEDNAVKALEAIDSPNEVPEDFDELPVELVSLIDRFIESLTVKVYNTPPSIEKLSAIFQDFYAKASLHIATHINALGSQQSRGASPHASFSSKTSQTRQPPRSSSRDTLSSLNSSVPEQQMLTPQEVSDRRKARRLLDRKGVALEEAVERRVCERVYCRIWRHRSTLDEVRDEKLRSKTAALAVVGIGMKDLGVDLNAESSSMSDKGKSVDDWISRASDGLLKMNDAKSPLGKLQTLATAHKIIVDMLTAIHHGSSSADEILPTLIYTLISSPPEGINVISNLQFIQRFRNFNKIDGEAAYCLTNLEAAISFLEDVDLASLRSEEAPERRPPSKDSTRDAITTPAASDVQKPRGRSESMTGTASKDLPVATSVSDQSLSAESQSANAEILSPSPSQATHRRRVSDLFQPPAGALGAAGDAVRNRADQGIKGIGAALDNSYKLLFGRLDEQKITSPNPDRKSSIEVPRTLDEARKLMETKPTDEESLSSDMATLNESLGTKGVAKTEDGVLSAIAGRKHAQSRDRSVDSNQSAKAVANDIAAGGNAAIESMRNFGHSINPLKGLGGMNMIRGFGRTSSSGTPTLSTVGAAPEAGVSSSIRRDRSISNSFANDIKTLPPVQRFLDAPDAQSLKVGDVPELLADYQRLAQALKTLGAF